MGRLVSLVACLLTGGVADCWILGVVPDGGACCSGPASDSGEPDTHPCSGALFCACCVPGPATTVAADWVPPAIPAAFRLAAEFQAAPEVYASRPLRPPCA
ncbi:MAG: hypothetical protein AAB152_07030 [Candidatus Coatesbacteria bacterium]